MILPSFSNEFPKCKTKDRSPDSIVVSFPSESLTTWTFVVFFWIDLNHLLHLFASKHVFHLEIYRRFKDDSVVLCQSKAMLLSKVLGWNRCNQLSSFLCIRFETEDLNIIIKIWIEIRYNWYLWAISSDVRMRDPSLQVLVEELKLWFHL